jgi:xanthine/uracil permease
VNEGASIAYTRDARIPLRVLCFAGLQHTALIVGVCIALPLLVLDAMHLNAAYNREAINLSFVALAASTLLQIRAGRLSGSGLLVPACLSAAYLVPCIAAARTGGPALIAGMLIFSGAVQVAIGLAMSRLRAYMPPEIGGLAVLMIGIVLGLLGFRLIAVPDDGMAGGETAVHAPWLGLATLATIAALTLWGRGAWRTYASLIGIVAACGVAMAAGVLDVGSLLGKLYAHGVAIPTPAWVAPTFDWTLAPEFAAAAIASSLRATGDLVAAQRIDDPTWVRPDLGSVRRGITADGLGTAVAGALGAPIGLNTFSGSVGLASATGVTARRVGVGIALFMLALALLPGAASLFMSIPKPVLGGVVMLSAAHIVFNGLLVIMSRMIDSRRIIALGVPLLLGLSYDAMPKAFGQLLPGWLEPMLRSDLMIAVLGALVLNSIFRIGVRHNVELALPAARLDGGVVARWVTDAGSAWGARADVMSRVAHGLGELVDARSELMTPGTEVRLRMGFDEFEVVVSVEYTGEPIDLSAGPANEDPGLDELDVDRMAARMRARLLRGLAQRASTRTLDDGRQRLTLDYPH